MVGHQVRSLVAQAQAREHQVSSLVGDIESGLDEQRELQADDEDFIPQLQIDVRASGDTEAPISPQPSKKP